VRDTRFAGYYRRLISGIGERLTSFFPCSPKRRRGACAIGNRDDVLVYLSARQALGVSSILRIRSVIENRRSSSLASAVITDEFLDEFLKVNNNS
jgi:hypothetical protein